MFQGGEEVIDTGEHILFCAGVWAVAALGAVRGKAHEGALEAGRLPLGDRHGVQTWVDRAIEHHQANLCRELLGVQGTQDGAIGKSQQI